MLTIETAFDYGDQVLHDKYGRGTVTAIRCAYEGRESTASVDLWYEVSFASGVPSAWVQERDIKSA